MTTAEIDRPDFLHPEDDHTIEAMVRYASMFENAAQRERGHMPSGGTSSRDIDRLVAQHEHLAALYRAEADRLRSLR